MADEPPHRIRAPLKRRRPGTHPTAFEKARYVELIKRDFVNGVSAGAIASKHGISTASLYRWLRESDKIQGALNTESISSIFDINRAIDILCKPHEFTKMLTLEAFFQFLVWVRWPADDSFHLAAMINCISSYLSTKNVTNRISDLVIGEAEVLYRYLTLDVVSRFSSPNAAFNPDFEVVTDRTGRQDDRQFYARVVNYLLSGQNDSLASRQQSNLGRLQVLVENDAFGHAWSMSSRTFKKNWRMRAASVPFLYVENYHSPFDWSMNPQDTDFYQSVEEVMLGIDEIQNYFAKAKWVISQMQVVLDRRALERINFPQFPSHLEAVSVENPPLPSQLLAKIHKARA